MELSPPAAPSNQDQIKASSLDGTCEAMLSGIADVQDIKRRSGGAAAGWHLFLVSFPILMLFTNMQLLTCKTNPATCLPLFLPPPPQPVRTEVRWSAVGNPQEGTW